MHNFHHNYLSQSPGAYYQPASYPEVTVRPEFNAKASNSTCSFVGFCSCCLMLTACTGQVLTAASAHLT